MRNKLFIFSLVALGMTLFSCGSDYLKEDPYSFDATGATDNATVDAQLAGLHRIVAEIGGYSSNQGYWGIWQIGTDVCSAGATQGVENPFYQYADLNSENAGVSYLWGKLYEFINNANLIIEAVDELNQAASAEARFFRAYAYDQLVTLWGDVPLLSAPVTVPTFNFTRQPVAEVDALIDEDITYAVANLPEVGAAAKPSRCNKDMARHLGAQAYLRMGMRDNSYYAKAEEMASQIIDGGKYQLIEARYGKYLGEGGDYYRDMFRFGNQRRSEGNTEAIWTFEMEYNVNVTGGTIDNPQQRRVWQPALHKIDIGYANCDSLGGRGNGRLRLSNFMKYYVWSGLQGDIRNSNFNIRRTVYYNKPGFTGADIDVDANGWRVASGTGVRKVHVELGDPIILYATDSIETMYTYCTKWGGYDPTDDFGYAVVKDWPMMRLGETYLLRAEARFRQGNTAGAADDINVLRDRAFKEYRQLVPDAGKVSASDINMDFILDERARELIGEENRRMTLHRTGMLASRIPLNDDLYKPITGFDANKHTLLPIPLSEIQRNKEAELKQNPGY
ncbi:RagB/SusD family nutrient uptake outer membrane protein [Proteiniphilum saccharofermentans]|uniref:RagB/SusD family nutrient uptake outer membrane protein n=1 Tax=Proteiniphilum saccharofermentans TaxID=1642647 RepID=UPI0028A91AA1|nr:RagB/SusD family nutrient uptake outer membrane protein [Proteiniphilum saccharofermentans]